MSSINIIARLLFMLLLSASTALAASITATPSGTAASFSVDGAGMDGVAGIQLDIEYAGSLSKPTVTQGGLVAGAMFVVNSSLRPGLIKIAIIRSSAFSGSGQIAQITFASGSGSITSLRFTMINSNGATVDPATNNSTAAATITTPGIPFSQTNSVDQQNEVRQVTQSAKAAAATLPTYLGTVTLPTNIQQNADLQPAPSPAPSAFRAKPPLAPTAEKTLLAGTQVADNKLAKTPQYIVYKSVLERFKLNGGSKKLADVAALFDKKIAQNIRQEPAILLNTGHAKAILTIDLPVINSSPNFAVSGGTLVSFNQDSKVKGRWIVVVLPEAGTVNVPLTIIAGFDEYEYPLTVALPVKKTLALDEGGWRRFLKEAGMAKAPLHDLNNDGVRDYIDEYIFVAGYLANKAERRHSTKSAGVKSKSGITR